MRARDNSFFIKNIIRHVIFFLEKRNKLSERRPDILGAIHDERLVQRTAQSIYLFFVTKK
jgi:hypothetical protein